MPVGAAGGDDRRVGDLDVVDREAGQRVVFARDEAAEKRALNIGIAQRTVGEQKVHVDTLKAAQ